MTLMHAKDSNSLPVVPETDTSKRLKVVDYSALSGGDAVYDRVRVLNACQLAKITADGTIDTGSGYLFGFIVVAGTNPTCILYDNTAASGTILIPTQTLVVGQIVTLPAAVPYSIGLHADIGGTDTPTFNVLYLPS